MKKIAAIILISILFYNFSECGRCKKISTYDSGDISKETLLMVPYTNADTLTFIHSKGSLIHFTVSRSNQKHTDSDHCATFTTAEDRTILQPDYPLFSPQIVINQYDSSRAYVILYINRANFNISSQELKLDSIQLQSHTYYNVWAMEGYSEFPDSLTIKTDSVYYNTSHGILRITMTNGEWYERKN